METEKPLLTFFSTKDIPKDHWALNLDSKYGVAILQTEEMKVVWITINPIDRRGYRLIIRYAPLDIIPSLNRKWTTDEFNCIFSIASVFTKFYYELGLLPQIFFAGNNAMEMKHEEIIIGQKEPAFLHLHILGRGNPKAKYIDGTELGGTPIGEEFNIKGEGNEEGISKKVLWEEKERATFKQLLIAFLQEMKDNKYFTVVKLLHD